LSKSINFDAKRQTGVWGLVMYGLSAFKYSLGGLVNHVFAIISRGSSIDIRVSIKDI